MSNYDRLFFTDAALLAFEKKLKKQLNVMGMSLRIGMQSPISLTLKPRVGITLIASSHDSLNTLLSLSGFFSSLTTISQNAKYSTKCSPSTSIGPLKQICGSDSPEIHFNIHFMYVSVTEMDRLQVSDTLCRAS